MAEPCIPTETQWVVLKFGGTSVASAERWAVIVDEVRRALEAGERPCVVVSAVSQVTNRLNKAIEEALANKRTDEEDASFQWIKKTHEKLADSLSIHGDQREKGLKPVWELLDELRRMLEGICLTQEASPKLCARIASFGELMSSQLGLLAIQAAGLPCARVIATKVIRSKETPAQQDADRYLNANVDPVTNPALVAEELTALNAEPNSAVITQGFIGSTPKGATCLLGRGGSDTSGALFAALLGAKRLEIWTDVHGLFTSDPRHVKHTRLIPLANFRVAQELASMGAKVLHPRCLVPAKEARIPVEVHNTTDPRGPFTRIEAKASDQDLEHLPSDRSLGGYDSPSAKSAEVTNIVAVTQRSGQVLLNITNLNMWGEAGFLSRVFAPFGELDVSVDLVATSQYAVSLTLDHIPGGVEGDTFARLLERLRSLGEVTEKPKCAVVSIVGEHLRKSLSKLGNALSETLADLHCNVHLMTQSSEDLNLSWVVDENQARALVQGLHDRLFPPPQRKPGSVSEEGIVTWEDLLPGVRSPQLGPQSLTPKLRKEFSGHDLPGMDGPSSDADEELTPKMPPKHEGQHSAAPPNRSRDSKYEPKSEGY